MFRHDADMYLIHFASCVSKWKKDILGYDIEDNNDVLGYEMILYHYYLRKWRPHARICVIYTTYATPHRKQLERTIASSLIIPPVQKHTLKSTQQSNEVFKSPIVAN